MPLPNARNQIDANFQNSVVTGDHTRHHICVIGGGAAGAQFYKESVQRSIDANLSDVVSYTIIDSRPYEEIGQGIAWNIGQSDLLLANMRVHTIGFSRSVLDKLSALVSLDDVTSLTDKELFRRRSEIGKILHEDFDNRVKDAKSAGIPFLFVQASCIAIYKLGTGYAVETDTGLRYFVDEIVLALGNAIPSSYPEHRGNANFQANPWDWGAYRNLDKNLHVGVIGLGPTAIDSILLLHQNGIKKITSYSREGQIQYPRPRSKPHDPRKMNHKYIEDLFHHTGLTFSQVEGLIHGEFTDADVRCRDMTKVLDQAKDGEPLEVLLEGLKSATKNSDWFAILKSFDDVTPLIWNLLPDIERDKYITKWRKTHTAVSYGMASVQARRIADLLQDDLLSIKAGMVGLKENGGGFLVEYKDKQTGALREDKVDFVINCSGIGTDIKNSENALVKFLVDCKFLIPHPRGGAYVDFDTGQISNENLAPQGSIYSLVGSLTYGTHLLTHCFGEVTKSAARTAQAIHRNLSVRYQHLPES